MSSLVVVSLLLTKIEFEKKKKKNQSIGPVLKDQLWTNNNLFICGLIWRDMQDLYLTLLFYITSQFSF